MANGKIRNFLLGIGGLLAFSTFAFGDAIGPPAGAFISNQPSLQGGTFHVSSATIDGVQVSTINFADGTSMSTAGRGASDTSCRVYNSTNQTVNSGSTLLVGFNRETYNTGGFHSTSTLNTRLVAPATGKYHIFGNVFLSTPTSSMTAPQTVIEYRLNGSTIVIAQEARPHLNLTNVSGTAVSEDTFTSMTLDTDFILNANDYIEMVLRNYDTQSRTIVQKSSFSPVFGMTFYSTSSGNGGSSISPTSVNWVRNTLTPETTNQVASLSALKLSNGPTSSFLYLTSPGQQVAYTGAWDSLAHNLGLGQNPILGGGAETGISLGGDIQNGILYGADVENAGAIAIGNVDSGSVALSVLSSGLFSTSLGGGDGTVNPAQATGDYSFAGGGGSVASALQAFAFGGTAGHAYAYAFGRTVTTTQTKENVFGSAHDAGDVPTIHFQGRSDTTQRNMSGIEHSWDTTTDSIRRPRVDYRIYDATGTKTFMTVQTDGTTDYIIIRGSTSFHSNVYINNGSLTVVNSSVSINGVNYQWPSSGGTANQVLSTNGSGVLSFVNQSASSIIGSTGSVGVSLDGGGSAIVAGTTYYVTIPYNCTVSSQSVIADKSGSISIHIASATFANFPTLSNMSGFGNGPNLSSQQKSGSLPNSWNGTLLSQGDIIGFVVDSASTVTLVNAILWIISR